MDLTRLYEILRETTVQLRKGPEIEESQISNVTVTEIFAMPHWQDEALPDLEKVDLELLVVGVDKQKAEQYKDELVSLLKTYPEPDRLASGPSYIEVGARIGDQGAAFQLFALGKVLGLWQVITPTTFGATPEEAKKLAGSGFIMITGFRQ